jgi:hypothetical protein
MALGWGRIVSGAAGAGFYIDDASAPVVKFQNIQAFGAAPVTVENRSSTNALVVYSCDMEVLGTGQGDIFVTDCASYVNLQSPGQSLWARQLNPEALDDIGLVRNSGGKLWDLGFKSEGAGVRIRTDNGGQTEVFGMFMYDTAVPANDPRPMFDVDNSAFCAMGVWEITFGNSYLEKVHEVRNGQILELQGGGWLSWPFYSGWVPAETNGPTAVAVPFVEPVGSGFLEGAPLSINARNYTWNWPIITNNILWLGSNIIDSVSLNGWMTTPGAQLRYTTDGSEPTVQSPLWPAPLTVANSVTLNVKGFDSLNKLAPSATCMSLLTRTASLYAGPWTSIAVQFTGTVPTAGQNSLQATNSAGVVPQTNWNVINVQGGNASSALDQTIVGGLMDRLGTNYHTSVNLALYADDSWYTGSLPSSPSGNQMLYFGYLAIKQLTTMALGFSNVPAGSYDVYVYGDVLGGFTCSVTIGSKT